MGPVLSQGTVASCSGPATSGRSDGRCGLFPRRFATLAESEGGEAMVRAIFFIRRRTQQTDHAAFSSRFVLPPTGKRLPAMVINWGKGFL